MSQETASVTHLGTPTPSAGFGQDYSALTGGTTTSGLRSPPAEATAAATKSRSSRAALPSRATRATLLDDVFADLRHHVDALQAMADQRREPRPDDPVADGMDWAIKQFRTALAEIDHNHEYLSTEQYAALHGVTPQSVCNWIRNGELEAKETPNGWRIKRGAPRQRKRRSL